jgi:hypothetical protein
MCSSLTSKLLPKEYEDSMKNTRSAISIRTDMMKMSNLASFNPKNNSEVLSVNFRLIVLRQMARLYCLT